MNELESMRIFMRVAELSSFTQTAQYLNLPNATVSTAVQDLEKLMGTRLLHRTTRKVQMTQDGMIFYERCKDVLIEFEVLLSLFQQQPNSLRGRLRVDMPTSFAKNLVIPLLPEFLSSHPFLHVELSSTDRRVDLVSEGFDCVVRIGTLHDSSLIACPLGEFKMMNCASPSYLQQYGVPTSLDDLSKHQLIHYETNLGSKSVGWEWFDGHTTHNISMAGALTVNNTQTYEAACVAGLGIIQAPEVGMRHLLEQGTLIKILPQYTAKPMPISLLYANRRHLSARIKAFMMWLGNILQPYTHCQL
ncbi:MAG: LysR family transcriptional regulator [Pseudomonadota bacterium]